MVHTHQQQRSITSGSRPRDRVGIVIFTDRASVLAKPAEVHSSWLQERTRNLYRKVSGNGTNIADGLRKSIDMLELTPRGIYRKLWLCTDGYPNQEVNAIMPLVKKARASYININCIGFGDRNQYDERLLKQIAAATHNGKYIPIQSLRALTDALVKADTGRRAHRRKLYRAETTVLCLDLSGSMVGPMEGKRKVDIVEEAILHLLHYKQQCFA